MVCSVLTICLCRDIHFLPQSRSGSGAIRPAPDAAASRSSSRGRAAASRRVPVVAPRSQWGRAVLQEAQASAASGALSSSGRQHHGSRGRAVTPTGQRASGGAAPASAGPRVGSGSSGAATMRSAARVASRWPALGLSAEDCFDEDSLYHPATVALYSGASKSGRSASAGRRRQRGGEGGGGGVTPEPRQGDGLLYASDLVASVPRSASAPRGVHSSGTGGRNIFKSPMGKQHQPSTSDRCLHHCRSCSCLQIVLPQLERRVHRQWTVAPRVVPLTCWHVTLSTPKRY